MKDLLQDAILSKWNIAFQAIREISNWRHLAYLGVVSREFRLDAAPPYSEDKLHIRLKRNEHGDQRPAIAAECRILYDIHQELDLVCPVPVPCTDGSLQQSITLRGVEWIVVLFHWIEGAWIEGASAMEALPPGYFRKAGRLTGKLHRFLPGRSQDLPTFSVAKMRRSLNKLYDPVHSFRVPDPAYRKRTEAFLGRCDELLADVFSRHGRSVVHGDVTQKNLLVADGDLCLLDFESLVFAPPILDMAVTLRSWRDHEKWNEIVEEYAAGYGECGDLGDQLAHLDYFIGLRWVALSIFMSLSVQRRGAAPEVEKVQRRMVERAESFLSRLC